MKRGWSLLTFSIDVKATAQFDTRDEIAFIHKLVFKDAQINRKRQELQTRLYLIAEVDADDDLFGPKLFSLTCEIYLIVNLEQKHFEQIDREGFSDIDAELYLLSDTIESFEFERFQLRDRNIDIPLYKNSVIRRQIERKIENVVFSLTILKREE